MATRTCKRATCGRTYEDGDGERNPDGWCPKCRAEAEDYGAGEYDRIREYERNFGTQREQREERERRRR